MSVIKEIVCRKDGLEWATLSIPLPCSFLIDANKTCLADAYEALVAEHTGFRSVFPYCPLHAEMVKKQGNEEKKEEKGGGNEEWAKRMKKMQKEKKKRGFQRCRRT